MGTKVMGLLLCVTALLAGPVQAEFWAISDYDLAHTKDTSVTPPNYWLEGFTFADHDIPLEDLVVGTTTGVVNVSADTYDFGMVDDFELNDTFAPRNGANPPEFQTRNFGGSPTWQDTNGADKFDFFIFEAGANDEFTVQPIFPDGTLGQKVVVPSSKWRDTGPEPMPDLTKSGGDNNNQQIAGIAFKITDLKDENGDVLANDAIIEGLQFTSPGMDPSCICAVRGTPFASAPDPADEATVTKVCPILMWAEGMDAVSEDVYFSADMAEVENVDASALLATVSQASSLVCIPGGTYADGLAPGTYYWRVVTTTASQQVMAGPIWSFTVIGAEASDPTPPDAGLFVDPDANLSWSAGADAIIHYIYVGTDLDTVANATDMTGATTDPTYDPPAAFQPGTTYYWRIDEFDGTNTTKGTVWSFTTVPAGEGGLKADYFTGEFYLFGDPVASRVDAQIDFDWAQAAPDPAVNREQFSARWKGEIEIPFAGTYTFITRSNDGSRIFVNDELVVEDWGAHVARDTAGTIDLEAGAYPIAVEYYQNGGTAEIEVLWQSDLIARQVIPSVVLTPVVRARLFYPAMGAANVSQSPRLGWEGTSPDATHRVFLGDDAAAVEAADTGSAGIFKGEQEAATYLAGNLVPGQTYYWRIDEVIPGDPQSPVKGKIWSFTVAEFIVVDDFENYTDEELEDRVYSHWIDGATAAENGGSYVGNEMAPFAEQDIVHSGRQAMNMAYDNTSASLSQAARTFTIAQNWTANNAEALAVWFRGQAPIGAFSYDADKEKYTITGSGDGVDDTSDGFRFAYKTLTGDGTVTALIESIERPGDWATASVMIRNTLEPGSVMATCGFRSTGQGFLRWRSFADAELSGTAEEPAFPATFVLPHWFRLTRQGSQFTAEHSSDGTTWEPIGETVMVTMTQNVFVGLAVSSDNANASNTAVFSNVTVSGSVGAAGALTEVADIGQGGNGPENFYVNVKSAGAAATVNHPDGPEAIVTNDWTRWLIDLDDIAAQGVNLSAVTGMTIGVGNPAAGGDGMLYIDDIRLLDARFLPSGLTVAPLDSIEVTGDDGMVLSINGVNVDDLVVGTTTTDFEKHAAQPAVYADDFDLGTYASLDDSSYIKMLFAVPVSTVFIVERGGNDLGVIQPLDADGNPIAGMQTFAKSDWYKPGFKVSGQAGGGLAITSEEPIYGIQVLPAVDANIGLDPASVSGVPAQ